LSVLSEEAETDQIMEKPRRTVFVSKNKRVWGFEGLPTKHREPPTH
jgi:hypothetical protein